MISLGDGTEEVDVLGIMLWLHHCLMITKMGTI